MSANVHIVAYFDGTKHWLHSVNGSARNKRGELYLQGNWTDKPEDSKSWDPATAVIIRRRLKQESNLETRITLSAGDTAEFLTEREEAEAEDPTTRTPKVVTLDETNPRWFVVRPGIRPAEGPGWFTRVQLPNRVDPETVWAETPVAVIERCRDLNWLAYIVEKYTPPTQPLYPQEPSTPRPRIRTGDLFN